MSGYFYRMAAISTMVCLLIGSGVARASSEKAQVALEASSQALLAVLTTQQSEEDKEQQIAILIHDIMDLPWMAQFSMGRYWKKATQKQRDDYIPVHNALLFQRYLPEIKELPTQQVVFEHTVETDIHEYTVHSKVISADGSVDEVDYKVRKTADNCYKVYDVIFDGISVINNHRSEFSAILHRKGIDYLIYKLGVRTAEMHKYILSLSL